MSIVTTRDQRRQLERDNAKLPKHLTIVPRDVVNVAIRHLWIMAEPLRFAWRRA
jgi:hypothetical protein